MDDLNKRIMNIEIRNKKVEMDKAWEVSWNRKLLILILTYIVAFSYLEIADRTNPFLGALVPCLGFFLSTLTLKIVKNIWIKKHMSGGSK